MHSDIGNSCDFVFLSFEIAGIFFVNTSQNKKHPYGCFLFWKCYRTSAPAPQAKRSGIRFAYPPEERRGACSPAARARYIRRRRNSEVRFLRWRRHPFIKPRSAQSVETGSHSPSQSASSSLVSGKTSEYSPQAKFRGAFFALEAPSHYQTALCAKRRNRFAYPPEERAAKAR